MDGGLPHLRVLPHLPGVPHLHVDRPLINLCNKQRDSPRLHLPKEAPSVYLPRFS